MRQINQETDYKDKEGHIPDTDEQDELFYKMWEDDRI